MECTHTCKCMHMKRRWVALFPIHVLGYFIVYSENCSVLRTLEEWGVIEVLCVCLRVVEAFFIPPAPLCFCIAYTPHLNLLENTPP